MFRNLLGIKSLVFIITLALLASLSGCIGGTPSRGRGWSAPAAAEQKVFITTQAGKLTTLSISARSGGRIFPGEGEWSFPPGQKAKLGSLFAAPAVSDGVVYLASLEGRIYALDVSTGTEKWKEPYQVAGEIQASPLVVGGKVFIAAADRVYAIDAQVGKSVWMQTNQNNGRVSVKSFHAYGRVWVKPEVDETASTLYFGTLDREFYAVDTASGDLKWKFSVGGAILTTPLVYKGKIYFGSFDGNLYALDAVSREKGLAFPAGGEWAYKVEDWIWSGPIRDGNNIYFATTGGRVYALNAITGKSVWPSPFEISSRFKSSPVIYKDALIIASQEGRIYSLNLESGQMKWASPSSLGAEVMANLSVAEDMVYVYTQGHTLYALDAGTGMQRWGYSLPSK